MNLVEATDIAVDFVRETFGCAKPQQGRPSGDKYLIELSYEALDDAPRLVLEVTEGEEPKLVGSIGRYGNKHGKQVR